MTEESMNLEINTNSLGWTRKKKNDWGKKEKEMSQQTKSRGEPPQNNKNIYTNLQLSSDLTVRK